jgi:hypothetical protein
MPRYRNYNSNSKYGRRKLRDQAQYNYNNGSHEYRDEIDEIGCWVWGVIIVIAAIIFILIAVNSGPDAALRWLK